MAININDELFKRYAPKKKIEIIKNLTSSELLATTPATMERIIKEAGRYQYKSVDKRLFISRDRQEGNSWNSMVEAVELMKGKLYLDIYFQTDSTDGNITEQYNSFFNRGEYRGKVILTNRYGDQEPYYFIYSEKDKTMVLKSILLEYVYTRYSSNLQEDGRKGNLL